MDFYNTYISLLQSRRSAWPIKIARLTPLLAISVTMAALQSFNFGFGIGHVNTSKARQHIAIVHESPLETHGRINFPPVRKP
jgi:hypothetical protein